MNGKKDDPQRQAPPSQPRGGRESHCSAATRRPPILRSGGRQCLSTSGVTAVALPLRAPPGQWRKAGTCDYGQLQLRPPSSSLSQGRSSPSNASIFEHARQRAAAITQSSTTPRSKSEQAPGNTVAGLARSEAHFWSTFFRSFPQFPVRAATILPLESSAQRASRKFFLLPLSTLATHEEVNGTPALTQKLWKGSTTLV